MINKHKGRQGGADGECLTNGYPVTVGTCGGQRATLHIWFSLFTWVLNPVVRLVSFDSKCLYPCGAMAYCRHAKQLRLPKMALTSLCRSNKP